MSITAGAISLVNVYPTEVDLVATAVTGATGPVTYQWYRSLTTGFSPDGSNILTGQTALTLNDTGLIPGTQYYYKLVATDTGHSNDQATYTQFAQATLAPQLNPNQFSLVPLLGTLDQIYNPNVRSVQVNAAQATALTFGQAVKMAQSVGGVPQVVACTADTDECLGFVVFNIRSINFPANSMMSIAMDQCVMWLYATAPISAGAQVCLDLRTVGGVQPVTGSSAKNIVGTAWDEATAADQLIRISLGTPSFKFDS